MTKQEKRWLRDVAKRRRRRQKKARRAWLDVLVQLDRKLEWFCSHNLSLRSKFVKAYFDAAVATCDKNRVDPKKRLKALRTVRKQAGYVR